MKLMYLIILYLQIFLEWYYERFALYIQSCTTCQRVNNRMERPAHSLHPIEVNSPWHRIGIDLIGPLPLTTSGNSYIVTCSDYFTKWPEAAAIPDKLAATVAKFLYQLITRHGSPTITNEIHYDFADTFLPTYPPTHSGDIEKCSWN